MSANFSPRPTPWRRLGRRNPDLARLFDAAYRNRRRLAAWYPWVPAPPARVGGLGCRNDSCYPVGALILLWKGWGYFRGPCPECGGPGLGFSAAGGLSTGRVVGVCRRCETLLERFVWGIGSIMSGIRPLLEDTPFVLGGPPERTRDWAPVALVAVLQELGATDLPDPRSPAIMDPTASTPRTR